MELRRRVRVLHHPSAQGVGDGVEQSPCTGFFQVREARLVPLRHHVRHAVDVDDTRPIEREDSVVSLLVGQHCVAVALQGLRLVLPNDGERFDQLADDAWQVTLEIRRVATLDDVIGDESEIRTYEHAGAETDPHGKGAVVGVPERQSVGVASVGTTEGQKPEVSHALVVNGVVFFEHLMPIHGQSAPCQVNDPMVRYGNVGAGCVGGVHLPKCLVGNHLSTGVKVDGFHW